MKNLKIKGKKLLGYIVAFVVGFTGFYLLSLTIKRDPIYQVSCIDQGGKIVSMYGAENGLTVDTLPGKGWKTITNITASGNIVEVVTESGKIIIEENK